METFFRLHIVSISLIFKVQVCRAAHQYGTLLNSLQDKNPIHFSNKIKAF